MSNHLIIKDKELYNHHTSFYLTIYEEYPYIFLLFYAYITNKVFNKTGHFIEHLKRKQR